MPYAGITSLDTLVSGLPLCVAAEKSGVDEVDPQETDISSSDSSETLRKTTSPFDFVPFLRGTQRRGGALVSSLEWLIGFAEGGGSFIVDKTGYISFQITQSRRDVQVLHRVRKILEFGSVRQQDAHNDT